MLKSRHTTDFHPFFTGRNAARSQDPPPGGSLVPDSLVLLISISLAFFMNVPRLVGLI